MLNLSRPETFPFTSAHPTWPDAVRNEHTRTMAGDRSTAIALLSTLGSPGDLLWPTDRFPAMELDNGHTVGSNGGHGSVRYQVVEAAEDFVRFEVQRGSKLTGGHFLRFEPEEGGRLRWTHQLDLELTVPAPALRIILALHDAILEQLLENAQARLTQREPQTLKLPLPLRLIRPVYVASERLLSARRTSGKVHLGAPAGDT